MPSGAVTLKSNRGPAAAADNRRAILAAARAVFAERGYHAPLNAIAKEAGVGQGVLYRHFSSRLDLALAVFETHFGELEALAAAPTADTLGRMWEHLVDVTVEDSAFIEMMVDARRTTSEYDGADRLERLLAEPLRLAVAAGRVDPGLTTQDLVTGVRMVFGLTVTSLEPLDAATAREALAACLRLPGLG